MTTFQYVAVDSTGVRKSGQVEANDRAAAVAMLSRDGRTVVEISEKSGAILDKPSPGSKRVSKSEVALFARRLADLSAAGLPLDRVFQVISEQTENQTLVFLASQALEDIRTGLPVSVALAKTPKVFPPVFTETLRAGEASGQFPEVANRLADLLEREVARRGQITAALIYPAILLFTAIGVVTFLLTFVVPRLSGVFADMGDRLPATTKILLAVTGFLINNGLLIVASIVGAIVLFKVWTSTDTGMVQRDSALLRAPVLGKVLMKAVVSRYARILGTLVYGGVPILEGLHLAGLAAGNKYFEKSSDLVANEVRHGQPINIAMKESGVFPPVLTHMVAVGEETGDLPKMLNRVSDSLDFEVDLGMRRLVAMAEPIIVIGMGLIVGFVVLSILLPIYEAQNSVK